MDHAIIQYVSLATRDIFYNQIQRVAPLHVLPIIIQKQVLKYALSATPNTRTAKHATFRIALHANQAIFFHLLILAILHAQRVTTLKFQIKRAHFALTNIQTVRIAQQLPVVIV